MSGSFAALQGGPAFLQSLKRKEQEYADRLEAAATGGGLVVVNAARNKAPYVTGTLKDSIDIDPEQTEKTASSCHVHIGTDVEYGPAQEFGTSKGVPAHPYMRPGLIESKQKVMDVMKQVLKQTE